MAALALALSATHGSAQERTIAVSRTSLSLLLYVARSQGFFAAEGRSVQTRECIGGQRCTKLMFDGHADLATASELPVMFNSVTRADYAIVATFLTSAPRAGSSPPPSAASRPCTRNGSKSWSC